jgi:hypothetical protein
MLTTLYPNFTTMDNNGTNLVEYCNTLYLAVQGFLEVVPTYASFYNIQSTYNLWYNDVS